VARLTPADTLALNLYHHLSRPVVRDLGLVDLVFEVMAPAMTQQEAAELVDALHLIHSHAAPPATTLLPPSRYEETE
jgi:hypothetical protein